MARRRAIRPGQLSFDTAGLRERHWSDLPHPPRGGTRDPEKGLGAMTAMDAGVERDQRALLSRLRESGTVPARRRLRP